MDLFRAMGVNLPVLNYYNHLRKPVEIMLNDFEAEIDRALASRYRLKINYRHVYLDLDDCLVINGRLNGTLMAFMAQCLNEKIRLHLLSRHKGDIMDSLRQYRIESLFDSVIRIEQGQEKHEHIRYKDSIFIDDSFRERFEVWRCLGIPVFAVDAIESLLSYD